MEEIFARYVADRHQAARNWKRETGKKVFGYFCCMTPEEILYAADVLPVRITGSEEVPHRADAHVPSNSCPFARSCLDAGMQGVYDYLDGVVIPNSCDIIFAMEYFWKNLVARPAKPALLSGVDVKPFVHFINYPQKITGTQVVRFYREVLMAFKQELERSLSREITNKDLARAVAVYNRDKLQMRRMYEMRKGDPPKLSGYEAWQVAYASILMPKDEHATILEKYLDDLERRKPPAGGGIRIYLSGSAMDKVNSRIFSMIEESGGQVVSDDLCIGTRSFWYPLDENIPPLEAIVRRSLGTACPRSTVSAPVPENRWAHLLNTTEGFNISGAIFYVLKCCDARLAEFPHLRDRLKQDLAIPVLFLEGDYTSRSLEQMRGRIEAFMEMIDSGDVVEF